MPRTIEIITRKDARKRRLKRYFINKVLAFVINQHRPDFAGPQQKISERIAYFIVAQISGLANLFLGLGAFLDRLADAINRRHISEGSWIVGTVFAIQHSAVSN